MSSQGQLPSLIVAALTIIATAIGCSPPDVEVEDAWHLVDLWREPAAVSGPSGLGSSGVRATVGTLRGRRMNGIEHAARDRLSWRLRLGKEATLSFRPNPLGGGCEFEVTVVAGQGPPVSVFRRSFDSPEPVDPEKDGESFLERVDVDLSSFAGRDVELVFSITERSWSRCRRAQWVSPTVESRQPHRRFSDSERPNVVLISADTLRADALGTWGRTPSVTPNLDRLASESDVWQQAYATCNSTNPSFVSLMTGLYPKNHGVFNLKTPLPEDASTLAELLRAEGYATSAVVSVRHLARFSGLRQGFDRFYGPPGQLFAETAVNLAMQELQTIRAPFFVWLHLFDPHTPQNPPAPFDLGYRPATLVGPGAVRDWAPFREPGPVSFDNNRSEPRLLGHAKLYPGEVSYLDWQVGRLLVFLESRGLLRDSLLIFVADHGENLGERNIYFNHVGLFDETVHVPLTIRWPGQKRGKQYPMLVQHFDIFPTILSFLEVEPPPNDAIDLRKVARSGRGRQAVFANHANDLGEMVRTAEYKYYRNRVPYRARGVQPPGPLLLPRGNNFFDLRADPDEQENLAGTGLKQEGSMATVLDSWGRTRLREVPEALRLSAEEREQLKALGYLR